MKISFKDMINHLTSTKGAYVETDEGDALVLLDGRLSAVTKDNLRMFDCFANEHLSELYEGIDGTLKFNTCLETDEPRQISQESLDAFYNIILAHSVSDEHKVVVAYPVGQTVENSNSVLLRWTPDDYTFSREEIKERLGLSVDCDSDYFTVAYSLADLLTLKYEYQF